MFHVGQEIICIDDSPYQGHPSPCKLNSIYTIRGLFIDPVSLKLGLILNEVEPPKSYQAFNTKRFRPVIKRTTNISIFTAMLGPKQKERLNA